MRDGLKNGAVHTPQYVQRPIGADFDVTSPHRHALPPRAVARWPDLVVSLTKSAGASRFEACAQSRACSRGRMKRFVKQLDGLLRGEQAGAAASGIALPSLLQMTLLLGSTYGFFMGWYAVALHWG